MTLRAFFAFAALALVFPASPVRAQTTDAGVDLPIQGPSRRARPTDDGRYVGYQVGGGATNARKSDAPWPDEGTWGWDYRGVLIQRRVSLNWWHGRRVQGGVGAYETERRATRP
jgi:hypothetical protein